jgi:hypothetical protein
MEDKICVSTYESCGSFKIYSVKSFKSLDDLRKQLIAEGFKSVGLAKSGWYDDYETRIESGIKIDDIQMDHVAWCKEETGEHRYLALYR